MINDPLPEGCKRYPKIMLSDGTLVEPASCWVVFPSTMDENDLRAEAKGPERLQKTADRYGGHDLAPLLRAALADPTQPRRHP